MPIVHIYHCVFVVIIATAFMLVILFKSVYKLPWPRTHACTQSRQLPVYMCHIHADPATLLANPTNARTQAGWLA